MEFGRNLQRNELGEKLRFGSFGGEIRTRTGTKLCKYIVTICVKDEFKLFPNTASESVELFEINGNIGMHTQINS